MPRKHRIPEPLPGVLEKHWPEIIERLRSGEQLQHLAQEFGVDESALGLGLKERGLFNNAKGRSLEIRDVNLRDFASNARRILWRFSRARGKHVLYDTWKARVKEFRERHSCSYESAVVQASKEVGCLGKLFQKYNVEEFDKYPNSHPHITKYKQHSAAEKDSPKAVSENIEQSYKENLSWAISAAGEHKRTNVPVRRCPNDEAFFLYQQALEDPKGFLARFSTAEAKITDTDASDRLSTKRATDEIDGLLSTILDDDPEEAIVGRLA